MNDQLTIDRLAAFVTLAEERHFTRAAGRLHVAQPALTKRIQQLEAALGMPLFARSKRDVRLTAAGEALLEPARAVVSALVALGAKADGVRAGEIGRLRIGFTPSAPHHVLPTLMRSFRRSHPGVECLLTETGSDEQIDRLLAGDLDVGILRPPAALPPRLVCRKFLEEPFVAVLPRDHPLASRRAVAITQLSGEPFVLIARRIVRAVHDQILAACAGAGFTPSIVQEGTHIHSVAGLVASGLGVSILPASAASLGFRDVVCRPLRHSPLRTVMAVATLDRPPSPAAAAFVASVLRQAG
jgi:DNA-binding transcriptional LysR family regulator